MVRIDSTSMRTDPTYLHLATLCCSGGRGILTELSLCYSFVYHYNGAQWYKQFLQVGRLDWALILLGLAFFQMPVCLQSLWCYMYICFNFLLHSFILPFSELNMVGLALIWWTDHRPSVL